MSRKRNHSVAETSVSPAPQSAFTMDPAGPAAARAAAADDFLDFEPDEELLCSVSDITEHLGRNITVVLETALSEIRKMVTVRIRVLKMELREKTDEIEILKARLERDGRGDPFPEASSVLFRKSDFHPGSGNKHNSGGDPKKAKPAIPGVKKENINAICDYLMKDKNSRGGAEADSDPSSNPPSGSSDPRHDPEAHALNLWTDGGIPVVAGAPGDGESDSATDDIFAMLPSGSKRIYDYEWMAGVDYPSDLKGMREPKCESATTPDEDDEDEDEETDDSGKGEADGLDPQDHPPRSQGPLSHGQTADFPLRPHESPGGEGRSPMEPGQPFAAHTYLCPLCGTFCPDSLFLEEHLKLIHTDGTGPHPLQQSTSGPAPGGLGEGSGDPRRVAGGPDAGTGAGTGVGGAAAREKKSGGRLRVRRLRPPLQLPW